MTSSPFTRATANGNFVVPPPLSSILHDYEEAKAYIAGLPPSPSAEAEFAQWDAHADEPLPETEAIDLRTGIPPVPGPLASREPATTSGADEPEAPAERSGAEHDEVPSRWRRWPLRLRRLRAAG